MATRKKIPLIPTDASLDITGCVSIAGRKSVITFKHLSMLSRHIQLKATSAEINTGTDETKYVTPDALAGSNAFTKTVQQICVEFWGTELAVADGRLYIIPAECNGMNLISARADVITAGTTNASHLIFIM